jgi:elongation factor 1-beta
VALAGLDIDKKGDEIMGEVGITYRILPESPEIDLNELAKKIRETAEEKATLQGMQEKPIAFGLNALLIRVIIEDKEGGPDEIESALNNIPGVQSVEVMDMSRLL